MKTWASQGWPWRLAAITGLAAAVTILFRGTTYQSGTYHTWAAVRVEVLWFLVIVACWIAMLRMRWAVWCWTGLFLLVLIVFARRDIVPLLLPASSPWGYSYWLILSWGLLASQLWLTSAAWERDRSPSPEAAALGTDTISTPRPRARRQAVLGLLAFLGLAAVLWTIWDFLQFWCHMELHGLWQYDPPRFVDKVLVTGGVTTELLFAACVLAACVALCRTGSAWLLWLLMWGCALGAALRMAGERSGWLESLFPYLAALQVGVAIWALLRWDRSAPPKRSEKGPAEAPAGK